MAQVQQNLKQKSGVVTFHMSTPPPSPHKNTPLALWGWQRIHFSASPRALPSFKMIFCAPAYPQFFIPCISSLSLSRSCIISSFCSDFHCNLSSDVNCNAEFCSGSSRTIFSPIVHALLIILLAVFIGTM